MTIDDLTPDAQRAAVTSFAKFYLSKAANEGLDVFAQRDTSGHIADINQWLSENASFRPEDKLAGLIANRYANFVVLLKTIDTPFNGQGIAAEPWADWFATQQTKIAQGR